MSSFDNRPRSMFSPMSGLRQSTLSLGPLSTEDSPTTPLSVPGQQPGETQILPAQPSPFSPAVTRQLTLQRGPGATRVLTEPLSGTSEATAQRAPVVIKGQRKKATPVLQPPHKKRRMVVSLVGMFLLFVITFATLFTVTPLGHDLGLNFNPLLAGSSMVSTQNNSPSSLVAQATATAVYNQQNDGYGGGAIVTNSDGSLNWPYGQCTYWANQRYHFLTSHWVTWSGNADQWVAGAQAAGWIASRAPHVPSIIVLIPTSGANQGESWLYGHVAVVEKIIDSTTVYTSNMNWYANGGGLGRVSYVNFHYGPGYPDAYFIWHS